MTLNYCNISETGLPHMEGVAEKSISPVESYEKSTAIFRRWTKGCKQREKRIFNVSAKQPSKDKRCMDPPVCQKIRK